MTGLTDAERATYERKIKTREQLRALFEAGADVFRLNFSHGTQDDHKQRVDLLRALEKEYKHPIAILMDLQGPKLRLGVVGTAPLELKKGQKLRFDLDKMPGDGKRVPLPHPEIFRAAQPGGILLIDDGVHDGKRLLPEGYVGEMRTPTEGLDLIPRIRSSPGDFPVVIYSGKSELTLVKQAMKLGAADYVLKRKPPALVERLCQCLQDPVNFRVNRAAYLLGRLEDRSAVGPLIRALATRHVVANPARNAANADSISLTVPKDAAGLPQVGFFRAGGDDQPATLLVATANPEVHAALIKLTGQDFGYHESMWLHWHAASNRAAKSGLEESEVRPAAAIAPVSAKAAPVPAAPAGRSGR